MIVVTGGAGFIGSNIAARLVAAGERVMVVDDLTNGRKFSNLAGLEISDYLDKDDFLEAIRDNGLRHSIKAVYHQGACSRTDEWDGNFIMKNNFEYSRVLFHYCLDHDIPLVYASSAAVYGKAREFAENAENECPLNPYGFSKLMFDRYLRSLLPLPGARVTGLRYFNVYGPGESHKAGMASVVFHFDRQLKASGQIALFEGTGGFADGEQRRDFVYIDDVVKVNLWAMENASSPGILNVGTGTSRTFNEVARQVIEFHGRGEIKYIPFPERLAGAYQSDTQASLKLLNAAGYRAPFSPIEDGIRRYLEALNAS